MSNLSTSDDGVHLNVGPQPQIISRPKFQPIRVKALLHFCESDDDESEGKAPDSESDTDPDDPQPLLQNDSVENVTDESFEDPKDSTISSNSGESVHPNVIINNRNSEGDIEVKSEHALSDKGSLGYETHGKVVLYNDKYEGERQDSHKIHSTNSTIDNVNRSNTNVHSTSSHNIKTDKNQSRNIHISNVENKLQSNVESECSLIKRVNEDYSHKNEQLKDQLELKQVINPGHKGTISVPQVFQAPVEYTTMSSTNTKSSDQGQFNNEKHVHITNSLYSESVSSDTGISLSSGVMDTPMKHPPGSLLPNTSTSHKSLFQTPQNKLSNDISRSHIQTPATIFSHWCPNHMKQTPLQCNTSNVKESMQTPRNSIYPLIIGKHGTPRYFNAESKSVRRPLMDTGPLIHKEPVVFPLETKSRVLHGSQLSKVEEVTHENQINLCANSTDNVCCSEKKVQETVEKKLVQSDPIVNDDAKENKHPNIENNEKSTQNVASESKDLAVNSNTNVHVKSKLLKSHGKDDNAIPNKSENKNLENKNSENNSLPNKLEGQRQIVDSMLNIQFSVPSNTIKQNNNKTITVKNNEYLILGNLGQGMSGEVLRVQELASSELRAIKCVNLSRMDKDSAQGCLEEISMLHKLQASCVVRMFDYEIKYPMVYVVMEMGDTDLSRLLKSISQEKQLPLTMILYYWTEMLTAVKHIHDNGVIHSDLKPANFLLVRGRLKLIDFGIASSMNADMTSVVKNCPIGTLNYISPEALTDAGGNADSPTHSVKYKISFKSDVWSLGCILYSLVYGHTPFHHIRSQWAKVNAITNPKPKITFPTVSGEDGRKTNFPPPILIDVIRKCLQHDPKTRPTVAELLQIPYVPTKPESTLTSAPEIPANILVKLKHALNEEEWRQLIQVLEIKRCM